MAKPKSKRSPNGPEQVRQDGGLEVHFVNTGSHRRPSIESWEDLLDWSQCSGAVTADEAKRIRSAAKGLEDETDAVLERALALRQAMRNILKNFAVRQPPNIEDLDAFNSEFTHALAFCRLTVGDDRCRWTVGAGNELERMLRRVVLSAAELFCSEDSGRIRRCAAAECGAFFVDRSPGARRKWCDATRCGHRTRSNRHYHGFIKPMKESSRGGENRGYKEMLKHAVQRHLEEASAEETNS